MSRKIIEVEFEGNMRINAVLDDMVISTDQPVKEGGDGTAPNPFQLFLASLATCAGVYAKRFCDTRKIATRGLGVRMACDFAEKGYKVEAVTLELTLPYGFPEKYTDALVRAVDLCTVKKHLIDTPEFHITTK